MNSHAAEKQLFFIDMLPDILSLNLIILPPDSTIIFSMETGFKMVARQLYFCFGSVTVQYF